MPVGIRRLNAKKSQPNPHVIFIKPLKGPNEATAQDFLERIAAQCLPIMKEHSLSIMSLEEYEPNREFWGRNFNAGEVIQLVLRSPLTGRWLPFEHVQMVMMHELAHCKQMNHSRAFWAVRNAYAEQMRALWSKGYTGEGLWGRGTSLATGQWEANTILSDEPLPEHLCGGTFRSRRKKRKGPELTWQQKKERRVLKKFGPGGVALGEDEEVKVKLEKGRRTAAKPRVAGSKRGRELRAAAALARFGQQDKKDTQTVPVKKEEDKQATLKADPILIKEEDISTASEPDSEGDSEETRAESSLPDAVDIDGKTALVDSQGHGMVKVCEDENPDDQDARQELSELSWTFRGRAFPPRPPRSESESQIVVKDEEVSTASEPDSNSEDEQRPQHSKNRPGLSMEKKSPRAPTSQDLRKERDKARTTATKSSRAENGFSVAGQTEPSKVKQESSEQNSARRCSACSFANEREAFRCDACANVMNADLDARSWRCNSKACSDSAYVNAGDCGVCGVCGQRKQNG